jgi:methyl-accepting chemotaxis protein
MCTFWTLGIVKPKDRRYPVFTPDTRRHGPQDQNYGVPFTNAKITLLLSKRATITIMHASQTVMSTKKAFWNLIIGLSLLTPLATAKGQSFSVVNTQQPRDQIALQLGAAQMGYPVPFKLSADNMQEACNALVMGRNALDAAVGRPAVKVKNAQSSPNVESLEYRDQLYSAVERVVTSPVVGALKGSVVLENGRRVAVYVKLNAPPNSWTIPVPFALESRTTADVALEAEILALTNTLNSLSARVASLQESANAAGTLAQNLAALVARTASLETTAGTNAVTVDALSRSLGLLANRATSIETNAGTTASSVALLSQNLGTLSNRTTSLETSAGTASASVDSLFQTVTALVNRTASVETTSTTANASVGLLSQNLSTLSTQTSLIERSVGATASDFNRLKASVLSAGATLDYERTSVATLAGSGEAGTADGSGLAAGFSDSTSELVSDGAGNLYLADGTRIRSVTPTGVVTTVAGSGAAGFIDGTGLSASFTEIHSLSADASGNLYLIDGGKIRKVTPERVVTTWTVVTEGAPLAFDSAEPELEKTRLLTLDTLGNVYALGRTGSGGRRLLKISAAGQVTTLAGSDVQASIDGVGTGASFGHVVGIVTDSLGNVYVSENEGSESPSKIRKVTPAGAVTTLTKPLGSPISQMVADQAGNVFGVSTMQGPSTFGDFGYQYEVILKVAPDGAVTVFAGSERDSIYGDLRDGVAQKATLGRILSMNTDTLGNVYFASRDDAQYVAVLRKVSAMGVVSTLAGLGTGDGGGGLAGFSATVTGIAPDKAGNVYVLDAGAYKIRKITPSP